MLAEFIIFYPIMKYFSTVIWQNRIHKGRLSKILYKFPEMKGVESDGKRNYFIKSWYL